MELGAPVLEARDLVFEREVDGRVVRVLDHVSLAIRPGDIIELRGESGAGKTTLLRALARLLPGVCGELVLDGRPDREVDPRLWRTRVTLLPQRAALLPGSVEENLGFPFTLAVRKHTDPPSAEKFRAGMDALGLDDVALSRDVTQLSVGQAARVALLRVLLARPAVLLLDEPDASLDDASAARLGEATARFAAEGGALVRVSHLRADATATRSLRLAAGQLMEVSNAG
ncbi:MAG: ATP-binding cassette domain-containing protein [Coriobacteriales bacterium]|nr:ATP-binding cassette domain-containing protein [Actinomycetes bacterium]